MYSCCPAAGDGYATRCCSAPSVVWGASFPAGTPRDSRCFRVRRRAALTVRQDARHGPWAARPALGSGDVQRWRPGILGFGGWCRRSHFRPVTDAAETPEARVSRVGMRLAGGGLNPASAIQRVVRRLRMSLARPADPQAGVRLSERRCLLGVP